MRGLLQRFFPALAGNDAAFRIEVEKDVIPTVLFKPIWTSMARSLLRLEWLMKIFAMAAQPRKKVQYTLPLRAMRRITATSIS